MSRTFAFLVFVSMLLPLAVRADDYGPARTVGQIRAESARLLARQARAAGVEPKNVVISDVVVSGDEALLSWSFARRRGLMGLLRQNDRWWDAWDATLDPEGCWEIADAYPLGSAGSPFPAQSAPADYEPPPAQEILTEDGLSRDLAAAAAEHNADVRAGTAALKSQTHDGLVRPIGCQVATYTVKPDIALHPQGGTIAPRRFQTSGYGLTFSYAPNDAASAQVKHVYVRPPTAAEFLPNHPLAPGWGYANAVCFFDVAIAGGKPVTIKPGTVVTIWFPFVLDDQLEYSISFFSNEKPSGLLKGTIFDNTVRFVLPEFTVAPDKPLMAEIDGDPKPAN